MTSLRLLIFSSLLLFVSFFVPVYCIPFLATTKRSLQLKKHLNFQQQNLTWFNISVVDVVWSWFPVKRVLFYFSHFFSTNQEWHRNGVHISSFRSSRLRCVWWWTPFIVWMNPCWPYTRHADALLSKKCHAVIPAQHEPFFASTKRVTYSLCFCFLFCDSSVTHTACNLRCWSRNAQERGWHLWQE